MGICVALHALLELMKVVLCSSVLSLHAGKCCIADCQFGVSSQVSVGKDN